VVWKTTKSNYPFAKSHTMTLIQIKDEIILPTVIVKWVDAALLYYRLKSLHEVDWNMEDALSVGFLIEWSKDTRTYTVQWEISRISSEVYQPSLKKMCKTHNEAKRRKEPCVAIWTSSLGSRFYATAFRTLSGAWDKTTAANASLYWRFVLWLCNGGL